MKIEFSEISDPWVFGKVEKNSRRIGRTRSPIIAIEKAVDDEVLLIKKKDGSIYAVTDLTKKTVRIK